MRVLLVHDGSCRSELKQIAGWLSVSGCEVVFFDLTSVSSERSLVDVIKECDVIIFLVTSKLPIAEATIGILSAKGKGKKIVGVRLANTAVTKEFAKYASALIALNQQAVIANVCGNQSDWTDLQGERRPEPKTKRHKC